MFWPFRRRATRLDQAEAKAVAALQCQRVHAVREEKARILRERLLAVVPAEASARVRAKLAQAAEAQQVTP